MTDEVWKDIEGYEGLYQVSNLGRVRSLDRIDGAGHLRKERILSPVFVRGYLQVHLSKEGKRKHFQVHRLVGQVFIPNPEGLPQINHKDEDKTNNVVFLKDDGSVKESNLEWCDCKYNINYGTHRERMVQTNISNGTYDPELCGIGDEKERKRLYYQKNRDQINERKRQYFQENREKILEYKREWRKKKKKDNRPSDESLW